MTKIFRDEELDFFEKISWDKNPLHRNDGYARRSQFGQKVVYGIYATLFGIGHWLNGRNVKFTKIKADFKKPLFLNEEYEITLSESSKKVEITFSKSGQVRLKIKITDYEYVPTHFKVERVKAEFRPKMKPETEINFSVENILSLENLDYEDNWIETITQPSDFTLNRFQLPHFQMMTFLWSTYFVGMEIPGQQALYSAFEFDFSPYSELANQFRIDSLNAKLDTRFNQIHISGSSKLGLNSFQITTFNRPNIVNYSLEAIRNVCGGSERLSGKTALITGASRGFGAVLAKALALNGANVILNFNQSQKDAEDISNELIQLGVKALLLQGDITSESEWEKMKFVLKNHAISIDLLIHNASPNIPMVPFSNQDSREFMAFINQSLKMVHEPSRHLLPLMKSGGTVVHISSIYASEPIAGFSHYITAKMAAEGLMQSLATEFTDLHFLIARPPKMLTDQTNSVLAKGDTASPIEVATSIVEALENEYMSGHASIIN